MASLDLKRNTLNPNMWVRDSRVSDALYCISIICTQYMWNWRIVSHYELHVHVYYSYTWTLVFLVIHDMTEDNICRINLTIDAIWIKKFLSLMFVLRLKSLRCDTFLNDSVILPIYTVWLAVLLNMSIPSMHLRTHWLLFHMDLIFFLVRCWTRWWIESQPCRVYPECYMTWPLSPRAPQSGSSVMGSHKWGLRCPRLKQIKLVLDRTVNCDTVIKVSNFYLWLVCFL